MWACLRIGMTYCGICFAEEHRDLLLQRMCKFWKDNLVDAGPAFKSVYNARYANAMHKAGQQSGCVDETAITEIVDVYGLDGMGF